jgi:NADH dehydrogenase FAD-containing subunit
MTDKAVTIVSPNSYFSFTPFLASTTVGTLEYRCATEPVRGIKGASFSQGWAERIGTCPRRAVFETPSLIWIRLWEEASYNRVCGTSGNG